MWQVPISNNQFYRLSPYLPHPTSASECSLEASCRKRWYQCECFFLFKKSAQKEGPRTGILPSVQFLCTFRRSIIWNTNHAFTGCFQLVCQVEWIVRSRILLFVKSNLTFPIFSEIYNYKVSTDWTRCIMFSKLYLRTQIQMIFSTFSKRGGGSFFIQKNLQSICLCFLGYFWKELAR